MKYLKSQGCLIVVLILGTPPVQTRFMLKCIYECHTQLALPFRFVYSYNQVTNNHGKKTSSD